MPPKSQKNQPKKPVVVVEIGNDWLKVIKATPTRSSISISHLFLEHLERPGVVPSNVLKGIFSKVKPRDSEVIALLPRQAVNIRMMELPSTDPEEVAGMVDLQAAKQTPYSSDEIVFDHRMAGEGREGYTRVMLAIVQRSVLRQRFFALEEAGAEVSRMSVTSEGLLNWLLEADGGGKKVTALVDVDSSYSDFSIVSEGNMVFSRSILVGADQLFSDYAASVTKFVQEARRSIEARAGESSGERPDSLVLGGAGPRIEGLKDDLQKELGMEVRTADCMAGISAPKGGADISNEKFKTVSLSPLIGAAGNPGGMQFDLVPDTVTIRKQIVKKAQSLTGLGILVMSVLVAVSLLACFKYFLNKGELGEIRAELARTEPMARQVGRMEDVVKIVGKRRNAKFSAISIISEIQRLVPPNVYFESMDISVDGGKVNLKGSGGVRQDIRELVRNLEQSNLFKDAEEAGETVRNRQGRFEFNVSCLLERDA